MTSQEKSTKLVDNLISSIANLYLLLLSFLFIYLYAGTLQIQHNNKNAVLETLDKLNMIRATAHGSLREIRPLRYSDLPNFFARAANVQNDFYTPSGYLMNAEKLNKTFPERAIETGKLFSNNLMRTQSISDCYIATLDLEPGHSFQFATFMYVGRVFNVPSERVTVVTLNRNCVEEPKEEFSVFIFKEGSNTAVAIPKSLERAFPGLSAPNPFKHSRFRTIEVLKAFLPTDVQRYADFEQEFDLIHLQAIEKVMLRYASDVLNRRFIPSELDDAIAKLYEDKKEVANFFGVHLDILLLLRLGPVVLFGLTFELWRRVRLLPSVKLNTDQLWFPMDANDVLGKITAYLMSLFPALATLATYATFAYAQELGTRFGGRRISIQGLLEGDFPLWPGAEWVHDDRWAHFWWLMLPIHCIMLTVTTSKLMRLVNSNSEVRIGSVVRRDSRALWRWLRKMFRKGQDSV